MGQEKKISMTLAHSVMTRKKGCFEDVRGRAKRTKPRDVPTGEVVII